MARVAFLLCKVLFKRITQKAPPYQAKLTLRKISCPENFSWSVFEKGVGGLFFWKSRVYLVLDDNGTSDPFPGLKVQVTYTELLPSFFCIYFPTLAGLPVYNFIIESNVPKAFCSRSVL